MPVHDVGSTDAFPCYVVSKYVDGTDLARRLRQEPKFSVRETVELVATLAEALHHAHKQGLVHRDIKPANILLDRRGTAFVADFGLALREEDAGKGPRYAGTPAYMSPEQARGEGHRVDGRSDIYSLGVVLYEMLTGRRPFLTEDRDELLARIARDEVPPPRQFNDSIPKELERICLKALSKRARERYPTALDLSDDLRHFRAESPPVDLPKNPRPDRSEAAADTAVPTPPPTSPASDSQPARIVPKGLRSFDAGDADFFLELLPGPRDRFGLPDSIRFWKSRIESTDPDHTFAVGLIYGPSGCGKSSLVKAGLLPRLPYALQDVLKLPGYTIPILERRLDDEEAAAGSDKLTPMQQLHGLCALAALGQVRVADLVQHTTQEPPPPRAECGNLSAALAGSRETALRELRQAADAQPKANLKARLAILALWLGDSASASEMARLGADPTPRTAFIGAFPTWHGDLAKLAGDIDQRALSNDPALLSALCLGIGSAASSEQHPDVVAAWKSPLEQWFQTHQNSSVHSAAGWALRQWRLDEPPLPPREQPLAGTDWFVTKSALTLIRIPAGKFVRKDDGDRTAKPQTVVLTRDLWLSDREVTVKLFHEFFGDKPYAAEHPDEALTDWKEEYRFGASDPALDHPVQQVSWEDAVRFCNWLSRRENRPVCYRRVKPDDQSPKEGRDWELIEAGTGYRLPTEAEWEYACRAGTAMEYVYSHGNEDEILGDYGWYDNNSGGRTHPVGLKKPNNWGLHDMHDMHGNVWEWCQDWHGGFGSSGEVSAPTGPRSGVGRVGRGGCWGYSAESCRSSYRGRFVPSFRFVHVGFRVARSSSGPASSPSAAEPPSE